MTEKLGVTEKEPAPGQKTLGGNTAGVDSSVYPRLVCIFAQNKLLGVYVGCLLTGIVLGLYNTLLLSYLYVYSLRSTTSLPL